jgi:DMSO/TMAO reductase YedYZ molybdopterin-dependent catalytic subunit
MTRTSFGFAAAFTLLSFPVLSGAAIAADPPLALTGLVAHPLHLSLADLKALPPIHVSATQMSGHGPVPLDCTGVPLAALLKTATPNFGDARNANLAHTLLVTGDDGYAVSLSFGEIDADYGKAQPLVATACGGKQLDSPRLVVPGDGHAGRSIQGVVSIEVK